jgi:hypothetical protein
MECAMGAINTKSMEVVPRTEVLEQPQILLI